VIVALPYATVVVSARVSQLPVGVTDKRSFPFSKPLIFLLALTAIYTIGLSNLAVRAASMPPPPQSRGLWTIIFGLILTWWVYFDRGSRNFKLPFEFECFVFFAWPFVIPYYLYRRLGGRRVLFGLGILVLYFVPFVIAAFAAVQIYDSR
jgi:hypothetical protein